MSRFLTALCVQRVADTSADGRGTWRLLQPLVYDSDRAHRAFVVPAGFVTDFASVPRIPVAFLLAGDTAHEAAVLHDWLYTFHQLSRAEADAVFAEAATACGTPTWRRTLLWLGVRAGGARAYGADGQDQPAHVLDHAAP